MSAAASTLPHGRIEQKEGRANELARCLVPLLDALGWRGDQARLFEAMPHLPEQMSVIDLLNTLANLKFEGREDSGRLDEIDRRLFPCLFLQEGGGAMVLVAVSDENILVFDGEAGENRQIDKAPTAGRLVLFKPIDRSARSLLKQQPDWFRQVLMRFRKVLFHAVAVSFAISVLTMISPIFVGFIYDGALISGSPKALMYLGIGMLFFVLADAGFRLLRSHLFLFVSARLGNIIGNEVFRRLLFLPPAFTETANVGAQIARLKDFETVRNFFSGPAFVALFELPFMAILLVAVALIGGWIVLVPIFAMLIFAACGVALLPEVRRSNAASAQSGSDKQAFTLEMLANMRPLKYTGATDRWFDRYRSLSATAAVDQYASSRITAVVNAVSYALVMMSGMVTLVIGVYQVIDGKMSIGALVACMMLVWRILAPLGVGFSIFTQIGRIAKSVDQVNRLMNIPLENRQGSNLAAAHHLVGRVAFSDVSIRYSSDAPPSLLGISFSVKPGETIAIVGHDGAGKTTILKLILGLYTPQAGRVLLDHVNARQLDPVSLRTSIAYAPKTDYLFYGTLRQNLQFANYSADERDIQLAASRAGLLQDVCRLQEGFDTRVKNVNLMQFSGSFQKRLSLARVFLRNSRLVLLDEPESALSAGEISAVIAALAESKGTATTIIATHDPSFFCLADKILWLENGRVKLWGPTAEVAPLYIR